MYPSSLNSPIKIESTEDDKSSSKFDKCIECFQKDILSLKIQNQELQHMVQNSNEPNSNLIQSLKLVQIERDQLYKENAKLKKKLSKYQTLNKQRQSRPRNETEESLISKNFSLLSENEKLKMQIEKKNFMIEKMKTTLKEKDSIFKILSNQYAILMKEKQTHEKDQAKDQNKSDDNSNEGSQIKDNQSSSDYVPIKTYNKICKILRQLKNTNLNLCNKIEKQKQTIDQLSSENNKFKNLSNQQSDTNYESDITLLQEKLKRAEREKDILHDKIEQNEATIEQLQLGKNGQNSPELQNALNECEELKSKNLLLEKQIEVNFLMQKENLELKKENEKMKFLMRKQVATQTSNLYEDQFLLSNGNNEEFNTKKYEQIQTKETEKKESNKDKIIDDNEANNKSTLEKVLYFPEQSKEENNESEQNATNRILSNSQLQIDKEIDEKNTFVNQSKNDFSLLKINQVNVTNEQSQLISNDGNAFLIPFNKNDPANININIKLKIKNEQVSLYNEEENTNEFIIEEESLSIISQITDQSREIIDIVDENENDLNNLSNDEVISIQNEEIIVKESTLSYISNISSTKDDSLIEEEEEEEIESENQSLQELKAENKNEQDENIDKNCEDTKTSFLSQPENSSEITKTELISNEPNLEEEEFDIEINQVENYQIEEEEEDFFDQNRNDCSSNDLIMNDDDMLEEETKEELYEERNDSFENGDNENLILKKQNDSLTQEKQNEEEKNLSLTKKQILTNESNQLNSQENLTYNAKSDELNDKNEEESIHSCINKEEIKSKSQENNQNEDTYDDFSSDSDLAHEKSGSFEDFNYSLSE